MKELRINNYKIINNLLLFALFFPYIGFFPGVDTQPTFFVLSIFIFVAFFKRLRFRVEYFIGFSISLFAFFFALFVNPYDVSFQFFASYIIMFSYLFVIRVFLTNGFLSLDGSYIYLVFGIYAAVGCVQFYSPDFLAGAVTRSVDAVYSFADSGRGVRSLSPEPATLGKLFNIFMVFIVFRLLYFKEDQRTNIYFAFVILISINALISRSAYAVAVGVIIFLIYLLVVNKKILFLGAGFFILFSGLLLTLTAQIEGVRIVSLVNVAFSNPELLLNQGAMRRVLNIPITINNINFYGFFGSLDSKLFFDTYLSTPIGNLYYTAYNRNLGGYVELIQRLGVFSLPTILFYFYMLGRMCFIRVYLNGVNYSMGIWLASSIFLLTFQDGSPSLALSWFALIYMYHVSCEKIALPITSTIR